LRGLPRHKSGTTHEPESGSRSGSKSRA
jgi:hypothetical protein